MARFKEAGDKFMESLANGKQLAFKVYHLHALFFLSDYV